MRSPFRRPRGFRRGVTLVEMLVVVALVVLMMTILVQIFQSATGAMTLSRITQELDVNLRQIDSMIRADLAGVTAKMTPPNDPKLKTGYFEYGENSPADIQGEDTDDYLAFTTKAPQGQVFSGRQWLAGAQNNPSIQPITITSQVGEVIYFLRNGNLYRRVFLVAPDRVKNLSIGVAGGGTVYPNVSMFGGSLNVSWQGMNDVSCRPRGFSTSSTPIPNDLGDLTNRENRAFRPRFSNDLNPYDGVPDDRNGDGVPDYYPTLYTDGTSGWPEGRPNGMVNEGLPYPNKASLRVNPGSYDVFAFPFIYPGMYSVPDNSAPANRVANGLGWIHYQPLNNHAPLEVGDNLTAPSAANQNQTWWGFPTWRETMTGIRGTLIGWTDPVIFLASNTASFQQPLGLRPFSPTAIPPANSTNFLPPIYLPGSSTVPYSFDGAGSASFVAAPSAAGSTFPISPNPLWEDDLILTNVRSFDVKAYDPEAPLYNTTANGLFSSGYHDLGYGAASYVAGLLPANSTGNPIVISSGPVLTPDLYPFQSVNSNGVSNEPRGFGHEGRIPPRVNDYRYHPRFKGGTGTGSTDTTVGNVGDDSPGVIRLTRVWDSWSTDYTNAPDADLFLNGYSPGLSSNAPVYPSFPPPYPSPLRGIQIQIRVVDPRNERSKVLTIRHDFTDKL